MKRKTVLVVDDDDNIRDTVVDILRMEGFDVEAFSSAEGVVERIRSGPADLVVTDLNMPDVDGIELIKRISAAMGADAAGQATRMPVILLSGAGYEDRAAEALRLGAGACFAKPFDIDEFIDTVFALVGKPGHDPAAGSPGTAAGSTDDDCAGG